jgi:arsenate reductase
MNRTRVLFLCTHNSARSQMAEGLLRHFYGEKYEGFSAGSSPTQIHPLAIKVMDEIGIDISKQTSKSIEEFRNKDIDVVVTVCTSSAKVVCPFCSLPITGDRPEIIRTTLPGAKRFFQHGFSDPSEVDGSDEEKVAAFRRTRDEMKKWVLDYFADLKTEGSDGRE